jgi:DNA-binding NarL/FixJ family response regulator
VVIFLATLLVGYRYALVITILCIISVWVMGFIPPANGFMPVMNGLEAMKRIREINPDIPVIAVTAFVDQEDAGIRTVAKFSGYVVKPIEKPDLIGKISSALN